MENNAPNYGLSKMIVDTYDDETLVNPLLRAVKKTFCWGYIYPSNKHQ